MASQSTRPAPSAASVLNVRRVTGKRMKISLWLAILLFGSYMLFTLAVAFAPNFLATPVFGNTTLALVLAIVMIVVAWLFTLGYMRWANRYHDAACDDIGREGTR